MRPARSWHVRLSVLPAGGADEPADEPADDSAAVPEDDGMDDLFGDLASMLDGPSDPAPADEVEEPAPAEDDEFSALADMLDGPPDPAPGPADDGGLQLQSLWRIPTAAVS